jgi:hypothetical protein
MSPEYRSRLGQRMTKKSFANRAPRLSRTAAVAALLAVAVLAVTAVGLIGGGDALADHRLGTTVQTARSAQALRAPAELPIRPVDLPQVPADAQEAQPMASF